MNMTLLRKEFGEKIDVESDVKLTIIIHVHHTALPIRISVINSAPKLLRLLSQLGVTKYRFSLQLLPLLCFVPSSLTKLESTPFSEFSSLSNIHNLELPIKHEDCSKANH